MRRLLAGVLAVALTAACVVLGETAALAGTNDYPSAWRSAPKDSLVDTWGYRNRESTSFVAWRLHARNHFEMPHAIGNAAHWDNYFNAHGHPSNHTPAVGAIAQTDAGTIGHVAWVEKVNSNGTVTIEEYNRDHTGHYSERIVAASTFRYIHPQERRGTMTAGVVRKVGTHWQWKLRNANSQGNPGYDFAYGTTSTDVPVVGDWDGNGTMTPGVVRKDGTSWRWLLRNANSQGFPNFDFRYGTSTTDIPVVGDWDGNGTMTPGVVRKKDANWRWLLRNANSQGVPSYDFTYGANSTRPVVGDWDGNGTMTVGVVRKKDANWRWVLRNANSQGNPSYDFTYGTNPTDIPVVGDWDGNGTMTVGVVRKNDANWRWVLRNANSSGLRSYDFAYGANALDRPVVGDWDGK